MSPRIRRFVIEMLAAARSESPVACAAARRQSWDFSPFVSSATNAAGFSCLPILLTFKFVARCAKFEFLSEGRALVVSGAEPSARPEVGLEKKGLSAPGVTLVATSRECVIGAKL